MPGPRYNAVTNPVHDAEAATAAIELARIVPAGAESADDPSAISSLLLGDDNLRVLDNKGKTYKFNVDLSVLTVRQLKSILEEKAQVIEQQQRLIFSGKELSNLGDTLEECGVKSGTVVHLFQRPGISTEGGGGVGLTATAVATQAAVPTSSGGVGAMAAAVVVGGADGNIVGAGPAHSSLAGNMELQVSRRRVKFLATILLLISVLNLVTLVRSLGGLPLHDRSQFIDLLISRFHKQSFLSIYFSIGLLTFDIPGGISPFFFTVFDI